MLADVWGSEHLCIKGIISMHEYYTLIIKLPDTNKVTEVIRVELLIEAIHCTDGLSWLTLSILNISVNVFVLP